MHNDRNDNIGKSVTTTSDTLNGKCVFMPKWFDEMGNVHCEMGPTDFFRSDGYCKWYLYGNLHRDDDKPAVIHKDGTCEWYQHGKRHRDGDKPAVIRVDGVRQWWRHDKLCATCANKQ
jgi:hypothetical protein